MIDKALILNNLQNYLNFKKDVDFAEFLGIKPQTLFSWKKRNTFDVDLIYAKCNEISADWLLTGKGEMLRNSVINSFQNVEQAKYVVVLEKNILLQEKNTELREKLQKCDTEKKILQDNRTIVL